MSSKNRPLEYSLAINEALHQMMAEDKSVFLIGQGVKSPWYVGNTATGLLERFGEKRVIDTPVSENAVTGSAVGAAIAGMKPIVVHPRMDFMMYAIDPIVNEAANWFYMSGGSVHVPVVIWGIINRGGEQAAQHSQALHALFAHIPGLKVVMPSTAHDAKGLMIAAVKDKNPVVFIDDRWLYRTKGHVPEKVYSIPIGKGAVRKKGTDITIVGISYGAYQATLAHDILKKKGVSVEIIDPRTVKPLDIPLIVESVKKTKRLLVVDTGWKTGGVAGEIIAAVTEKGFKYLKDAPVRITLPDVPAPMSRTLEEEYYRHLSVDTIVSTVEKMVRKK